MARFPLGRASTLSFAVKNEDGEAVTVNPVPRVTITDDAGVAIVTNQNTTLASGLYTYALPSDVRNELGVYTASYSYTLNSQAVVLEVSFEVVGNHLFEIADLRAYDDVIADAVDYPSAKIALERDAATERIENAADVAFTSRVTRQTLSGDDTTKLLLPHVEVVELLEAYIGDTALDVDEIEVRREGVLVYDGFWDLGTNNIEVRYRHGYGVTPAPVAHAAKILTIDYVVPSALPARATSQSTDVGDFRIAIANVDAGRDTGIPEVDAVIARFGRRRPVLG